jgi:dethiobiotin synthetase
MRKLPKRIFVAGIGTGIGKTVVSAILAEALHADYWKPVQCGDIENMDRQKVASLISNYTTRYYPEAYVFQTSASPHYAAEMENMIIKPEQLEMPASDIRILIEGAGGLLVPLSKDYLVIDLIKHLKASVILVAKNYLGSINHTLMSIEVLKQRNIDVLGIIFNGKNYFDNEEIIHHFSNITCLGKIEEASTLNKDFVKEQAIKLKESLLNHFEL